MKNKLFLLFTLLLKPQRSWLSKEILSKETSKHANCGILVLFIYLEIKEGIYVHDFLTARHAYKMMNPPILFLSHI